MTQKNGCEEDRGLKEYGLYLIGVALLFISYGSEILILSIYGGMVAGAQKTTMDLYLSQVDIVREMFLLIVGIAVYAAKVERKTSSRWFVVLMAIYFGFMVWLYSRIYCLVS